MTDRNAEILASLLESKQTRAILQVGIGEDELSTLTDYVGRTEEASLSVITLTGMPLTEQQSSQVQRLKNTARSLEIEVIETDAVKALPDFYFQNRRFDFALISHSANPLTALVAFYYVDQILTAGGTLVLTTEHHHPLKRLARYIATQSDYENLMPARPSSILSRLRSAARQRADRLPSFLKERFDPDLYADLLLTDQDLRIDQALCWFEKPFRSSSGSDVIDYEEQLEMDFDTLLEKIMSEKN